MNPTFKIIICVLAVELLVYMYIIQVTTRFSQKRISGRLDEADENIKYILQWTSTDTSPFDEMRTGRLVFIEHNCEYINCYVSDDRNYFINIKDFDAVVFNGKDISHMWSWEFPTHYSPKQKYIFVSSESSQNYPACAPVVDNYFNWTWTYKLDSDFRWGYFTVYDMKGHVIGPKVEMNWLTEMEEIDVDLVKKLSLKTKAVAWFVSNCWTKNDRNKFAKDVENELKKYNWTVDTYGSCGRYRCSRSDGQCGRMLEMDYFFYFSFENSFAEDYVTEKVLTALHNFVVPVVYGGANYSRFLPPGSYLDGRELGAKKLAETIDKVIKTPELYRNFHRWRNYYQFVSTNENNGFCKICAMLNNETAMHEVTIKHNLRDWWNGKFATC